MTSTVNGARRAEISRHVLNLKLQYLALQTAAAMIVMPQKPLLLGWRGVFPSNPNPILTLRAPGRRAERFEVGPVLGEVSSLGWAPMEQILRIAQLATGAQLGELLQKAPLDPQERSADLAQFVRHYRNGCAHDGRWDIRKPLPRPVVFEDVSIDQEDNSTEITVKVSPLHHVRLLDAVSHFLGPAAPQDHREGWSPMTP